MANAAETPAELAAMQLALVGEKGYLQAVWVTPDSVCFGPATWDVLLEFLCLTSKDALCHCSKMCHSLWYQVSSGITGLTYPESRDSLVKERQQRSFPTLKT